MGYNNKLYDLGIAIINTSDSRQLEVILFIIQGLRLNFEEAKDVWLGVVSSYF